MKKVLIILAAIFMVATSSNAQVAIEKSKATDNIYIGAGIGATTPLSFNSVFPVNPTLNVRLGKDFTPDLGFEIEGTAFFGDNGMYPSKTFFRAVNLGLNGILNWSNIISGYNGQPRKFEVKSVTGIGWFQSFGPRNYDVSAKTGLSANLNFKGGHSLFFEPYVLWNLTTPGRFNFNKNFAQLGLAVGYIYHFKTSNGTHSFKTYDVGAIIEEYQNAPVTETVVTRVEKEIVPTESKWFVFFAKGSSTLTSEAKDVLELVPEGSVVTIVGSASPEGNDEFNKRLSEKRAAVVADYLTKRNVDVKFWEGIGVTNETSPRMAVIIKQ